MRRAGYGRGRLGTASPRRWPPRGTPCGTRKERSGLPSREGATDDGESRGKAVVRVKPETRRSDAIDDPQSPRRPEGKLAKGDLNVKGPDVNSDAQETARPGTRAPGL